MHTKPGVGILIGIPTLGRPVTMHWANAYKQLAPPMNYNTIYSQIWGREVGEARNELARQAIQQDCKYLFFLGDDVIIPPHTLRSLTFYMENYPGKVGVVSGVYCGKSEPPQPLVFPAIGRGSDYNWKIGEVFPVYAVGMDCCLIRVELLRDLYEYTDGDRENHEWFKTVNDDRFDEGLDASEAWSEDLFFCDRVRQETDWEILCDANVICDHVDVYSGKSYTLSSKSRPVTSLRRERFEEEEEEEEAIKVVDLGSGPLKKEFWIENEVFPPGNYDWTRVDIQKSVEPDWCCDLRNLPFADGEFDIVFSSHALEHFAREETLPTLKEWVRVLKEGGTFKLIVPDILWVVDNLQTPEGEPSIGDLNDDMLNVLYGAQTDETNFHKNAMTGKRVSDWLVACGLNGIAINNDGYNIIATAKKTVSKELSEAGDKIISLSEYKELVEE